MSYTLEQFNNLPRGEAVGELLKCCGSERWAERVASQRPFYDVDALIRTSDDIWWSLDASDWLEAFGHHPKIGEKKAAKNVSEEAERWAEEEQAGTHEASAESAQELIAANREYEHRFGFIFIVCATGKSTEEMLALLKARLHNDADRELRVAAEEQRRITRLRLEKLIER